MRFVLAIVSFLLAAVLIGAGMAGLAALRYFVPTILTSPASFAFARSELFTWSARWWSSDSQSAPLVRCAVARRCREHRTAASMRDSPKHCRA